MPKKAYVGISDKARNSPKNYIGVNDVARKVIKGYIGVNDVAKQWWPPGVEFVFIFKDGLFDNEWNGLVDGDIEVSDYTDQDRASNQSFDYTRWYSYQSYNTRYNIYEYITTPIFMWLSLISSGVYAPYNWSIVGNDLVFTKGSSSAVDCTFRIPLKRKYNISKVKIKAKIDGATYGSIQLGLYRFTDNYGSPTLQGIHATYSLTFNSLDYSEQTYTFNGQGKFDVLDIEIRSNVSFYIKEISIIYDYDYMTSTHVQDEYTSGKITEVNYDDVPTVFQKIPTLVGTYYYNNYILCYRNNANGKIARVLIKRRNQTKLVIITNASTYVFRYVELGNDKIVSSSSNLTMQTVQFAGNTYYYYDFGNIVLSTIMNLDQDIYTEVNSNLYDDFCIGEIAYFILDGNTTMKRKEV